MIFYNKTICEKIIKTCIHLNPKRASLHNLSFLTKSKDIIFAFFLQFLLPDVVLPQFVFQYGHAKRADFEVRDYAVKLRETREAEENVDDVRGEFRTVLPILSQNTGQRTDKRF